MARSRELRFWLVALVAAATIGSQAAVSLTPAQAMPLGIAHKRSQETCAFTGKQAASAVARRPAVAVRVSNSPDARPQTGVAAADFVIETLAEGGLTRFVAVFHCSATTTTGPVRSARIDDAEIVSPFSRLLAFSGASPRVLTDLHQDGLTLITEATGGGSIYRTPVGSLDVNSVRADVADLRALARGAGAGRPAARYLFGDVQRARSRVSSISLDFGSTTVGYRWNSATWTRSQDGEVFRNATGLPVTTNNVLIQEVEANASRSLFDSNGVPSPTFDLVDSGRALLFRNGRVVVGSWTDGGPGAPIFRTQSGALMKLSRGRTWLEMVPSSDGNLTGSIAYR